MKEQVQFLQTVGFKVTYLFQDFPKKENSFSILKYLWNANTKLKIGIKQESDAIILHNTLPIIGIYRRIKRQKNVLFFVHNYRSICISGNLFRDGRDCHLCLQNRLNSIRYRCYKESLFWSILMQMRQTQERKLLNLPNVTTIFLSKESQDFVGKVVRIRRGVTLPNFSKSIEGDILEAKPLLKRNGRWIFAGRLSSDKGIEELLNNWPDREEIDIFGNGPLLEKLRKRHEKKNIRFLGVVDRDILLREMPNYVGGVFPSAWSEISSITLRDFVASGLPIIMRKHSLRESFWIEYNAACVINEISSEQILLGMDSIKSNYDQYLRNLNNLNEKLFDKRVWLTQFAKILGEN